MLMSLYHASMLLRFVPHMADSGSRLGVVAWSNNHSKRTW